MPSIEFKRQYHVLGRRVVHDFDLSRSACGLRRSEHDWCACPMGMPELSGFGLRPCLRCGKTRSLGFSLPRR